MRKGYALFACVLLLAGAAHAQDTKETEKRLQSVRGELREVTTQRRQLETKRGGANQRLREADARVGSVQRGLQKTEQALQRDASQLVQLQEERARLSGSLQARKNELSALLRAAQQQGRVPALKTLLAQQDVAEAERALALQGYLQRAQVARIRTLSAEIARAEAIEGEITQRKAAMEVAQREQQQQLQQLKTARQQRAVVLADIEKEYKDRSAREKVLGQDAKALQNLLAQLRAAAAKAAREAARAKAEQERRAKSTGKPVVRRNLASTSAIKVGGLAWPVSGNLLASFGGRMPDGRSSSGVLIAAAAGTPVKAVAEGTVVFSDWMTGYGNILIVDHGNGYMSLYAHNDGLLRRVGDHVNRGTAVATVGTSGGQEAPALYFELRHNGNPVNPKSWLTRQ